MVHEIQQQKLWLTGIAARRGVYMPTAAMTIVVVFNPHRVTPDGQFRGSPTAKTVLARLRMSRISCGLLRASAEPRVSFRQGALHKMPTLLEPAPLQHHLDRHR